MTYTELVELVAKSTDKPKTEVREILDSFTKTIMKTAMGGEEVKISGFGKFVRRSASPRAAFGRMTRGRTSIRFVQSNGTVDYSDFLAKE